MNYIHRMPFILSIVVTLIIGIICKMKNIDTRDIYIRMIISMIVFVVIGQYIKNTIINIKKEVDNRIQQEDHRQKRLEIENAMLEKDAKRHDKIDNNGEASTIDYKVTDEDEFIPFNIENMS